MKSIIIGTLLTIEAFAVTSKKMNLFQVAATTVMVTGVLITLVCQAPEF
jgi:hypothetical protein